MKKIILLISVMSVLAGLFPAKAQQIPQFSQYMFNGLYINPAYAGYKENMYAHLIYRNQWVGIKGAPNTTMLSIDGRIAGGSNLGLVYANDQIGPFTTNSVMLSYAFRFNTGDRSRLSFGLTGGALHYAVDKSKVDEDPLVASTENEWRPGVDVGVYFDMPQFYAGFSVMSLVPNKTEVKTSLLVMRTDPGYFLTFGGMIPLTKNLALMPSTLLKTDFKSPITFDINAMLMIVNRFWIGASYRTGIIPKAGFEDTKQNNAIALIAEAFITERIRLGVAYDFDLNHLANTYNGTFEVSLGYYLTGAKRKYSTPRYF
ncbi:MAG: type IX secretion system membrane protein PorP/SprF [Prevotellaceae bacterium]|jgi:type IX secretion system PorP/SprF family membrane protein|nr:type IX secretion system membrane protein PorP/SprF [Prevotellaceae bacterium]